jgi:hypothetical protein
MDEIVNFLSSLFPAGFDYKTFYIVVGLLSAGLLVLGIVGRFIFGKHSIEHGAVTSVIGILFIYALAIVVHSTGIELNFMLSPLPFISLHGDTLTFFNFENVEFVALCGDILDMIILAFVVNIIDRWMPTGKYWIAWLLWRAASVILGTLAFTLVIGLLNHYLPEGLLTWAPVILLGLLVLSLAVSTLKYVIGGFLASVNPLLALLYTFFFATLIGKMITKAMLTSGILCAMLVGLSYFGISAINVGSNMLVAYIPLLIALLILWYIIGKLWTQDKEKKERKRKKD